MKLPHALTVITPFEYADFEGAIPEGHYGTRRVTVWDRKTYEPTEERWDKIIVNIMGIKLGTEYCLIKTKFQIKTDLSQSQPGREENHDEA